jgi:hypothetical protein
MSESRRDCINHASYEEEDACHVSCHDMHLLLIWRIEIDDVIGMSESRRD